jgi:hypothetical protein
MTPTIIYKKGGKHIGPKGNSYSYKGVSDEESLKAFLANGWFATLDEAVAPKKETPKKEVKKDALPQEVKSIQYKDLTEEEKAKIKERLASGERPSEIGKDIGLHHLSVARVGKELSELD